VHVGAPHSGNQAITYRAILQTFEYCSLAYEHYILQKHTQHHNGFARPESGRRLQRLKRPARPGEERGWEMSVAGRMKGRRST